MSDAVLPTFPFPDAPDRRPVHVVSRGKNSGRLLGRSNGQDVAGRELRTKVSLADIGSLPAHVFRRLSTSPATPSLHYHVVHVALIGPAKQVIWVHAKPNVARMEDQATGGDRPTEQLPRETMSANRPAADRSASVSALQLSGHPDPAARPFANFPKKPSEHDRISGRNSPSGYRVGVGVVPPGKAIRRAEASLVARPSRPERVAATLANPVHLTPMAQVRP